MTTGDWLFTSCDSRDFAQCHGISNSYMIYQPSVVDLSKLEGT